MAVIITKPSHLAEEIMKSIDVFENATVLQVEEAAKAVAKETVKILKATSPRSDHLRHPGKHYADTWTYGYRESSGKKKKGNPKAIIYNKDNYRLTHLLENGHASINGGRVPGHPHIKPAEEQAISNFEKAVKKGIEKL